MEGEISSTWISNTHILQMGRGFSKPVGIEDLWMQQRGAGGRQSDLGAVNTEMIPEDQGGEGASAWSSGSSGRVETGSERSTCISQGVENS